MRRWASVVCVSFLVILGAACSKKNNSASSTATAASGGHTLVTTASTTPTVGSSPSVASGSTSSGSSSGASTAANTPVEKVVQDMQNSVVRVVVAGQVPQPIGPFGGGQLAQAQGVGTGMVLDSQGHILTNNHVVTLETSTPAQSVQVDLPNGKTVNAKLVGNDPLTDLAVIQISSSDASGLKPIQWADTSSIIVGEPVVAIGYALNLGGAPTVTTGVVSGVNRNINETAATISGAIQTDAAINPGNSGGPLLDLSDHVIGVNTAGLTGTSQQPAQGLNFAISEQTAQPVEQALIAQGHVTRGYMGVGVQDVTQELAQADSLGVDHGAGIGQVQQGSPAAQAGLKVGDIITKVGDVAINNTGDLTTALTKYGPGTKVTVTFYRGNSQQTTDITLGQRPSGG
jgi:putative serine protease PepD